MSNLLAEIVDLIDEDPLSTGHGFTEGPVWHPDGYLMFTDEPYIYRLNVKRIFVFFLGWEKLSRSTN